MSLLTNGYWNSRYFAEDYWQDDYWCDYACLRFLHIALTHEYPVNVALSHGFPLNLALTHEVA